MPDVSDNTNWFELDSANIQAPPNGWPEGQAPSTVNDCARSNMGALKRFWNRLNAANAITESSSVYTLTTSNTAFPTAYVDGELYKIRPLGASVGNDAFQINALPAKPIWKLTFGTSGVAIAAGDMVANQPALLVYNAALNGGAGAFILLNPFLPITQDGAGSIRLGAPLPVLQGGTGRTVVPLFTSSARTAGGLISNAGPTMYGINSPFTPVTTGKVLLIVVGIAQLGGATQSYTYQLRAAAGGPPAFAAAGVGTVLQTASYSCQAANQLIPVVLAGIITLPAGNACWVDVSVSQSGSAGASLLNVTSTQVELPI
jgi:hypothetical protein